MKPIRMRGTKTNQLRKDGLREEIKEGVVECSRSGTVPEDIDYVLLAKELGVDPIVFAIPNGYKRESATYKINADGTELEFKLVDVEEIKPNIVE